MNIKTVLYIPDEKIANLLCCAFEGGSGYWSQIAGYKTPAHPRAISDESHSAKMKRPATIFKHLDYPLHEDGAVRVTDTETGKRYTLDRGAIERGIKVMQRDYPRHFADFISENDDACTGDVFLQCCLLGKVVYG